MLRERRWLLTDIEQRLARDALGGLEYLLVPYEGEQVMRTEDRWTTEDIRWLLRPSGAWIDDNRRERVFTSLTRFIRVLRQQAEPEWWTSRGVEPTMADCLTAVREGQIERVQSLLELLREERKP